MTSREDQIYTILKLYEKITGRKALPQDTKPEQTYQWRYVNKFITKMEELGAKWETISKVAQHTIEHFYNKNQLKGLRVLIRNDIIDISSEIEKKNGENLKLQLELLKRNHEFLTKNNFDLLNNNGGGYPNIVKWYENKLISPLYLVLSESCRKAIKRLDEVDREVLPTNHQIERRRISAYVNKDLWNKSKEILEDDFIKIQ